MKYIISTFFCIFFTQIFWGQHTVTRLPYPINTKNYDEICPLFDSNQKRLIYTKVASPNFNKTLIYNGEDLSSLLNGESYEAKLSEIYQMISGTHAEDPYSSSFNQDVWYAIENYGDYKVYHPGYPLNDALPNSICSLYGKDGGFVIINQFEESGGMRSGFSTIELYENGESSFPEPFTIKNFNRNSTEINLSMSLDKQIIILAMDNGGQKDLYVSHLVLDTLYSEPVLLKGPNSKYSETTPYISQDKKTLYYASNRPGGEGGLDLYYCERLDYTYKKWSAPKTYNLLLNTTSDESHPYVDDDKEEIYFTSNKLGSSDIFKARLNRDSILHPIQLKINVIKSSTGKNFPAEISWKPTLEKSSKWPGYRRTRDGYHSLTIDTNEPISIKAENRILKSQTVIVDPQELQDQGITEYYIELILTKDGIIAAPKINVEEQEVIPELNYNLEKGQQVVLNNIYFQRSKSDILPESFEAIKALAEKIKARKNLIIQIEGHTDNIGDRKALMDLSIARAEAIKTLLIGMDVPKYQLKTKGYGATRPITDNSDEAHRRKNRRVEIKVLEN